MRWWVTLVTAGALAGCIEPQLQPCGAKLCSTDSVCLTNGECATRDAVDACGGLADGQVCHTSLFDGTCDVGACVAARCGDMVVSGAEQCDGPVADHDCVEFGFDMGVPACNDRCDLDLIASCVRFGWHRVAAVSTDDSMWANGSDTYAFLRSIDYAVEVHSPQGTFVDATMMWRAVRGNATTVYAVAEDRALRSTGGAWEELPDPALPQYVHVQAVTADGTLYIGNDLDCTIRRFDPGTTSWATILSGAPKCSDMEASGDGVLVGFENGEIRRYARATNTWSVEVANAGAEVLAVGEMSGLLFFSTLGGGLYVRDTPTPYELTGDSVVELVRAGDYLFYDNGDGGYGRLDFVTETIERVAAPTFGHIYGDATGKFYVFGNGIYTLEPYAWSNHEGLSLVSIDMARFTDGGIGVATTNHRVYTRRDDDYWEELDTADPMTAIAGHYRDEMYMSTGTALRFFDGNTIVDETPAGFTGINDLWKDPDLQQDVLWAVGDDALIMTKDDGDVWSTQTAPAGSMGCKLTAMAGDDTTLYAVGACGTTGIVWKRGGAATWSEVYRGGPPLAAITLASDGELFAAGPTGGARTRAGVWGAEPLAQGISISATTSTDVFVAGGPGELVRWDGTVWSRVALQGALTPRVIATPKAIYIAGASTSVLLRN